MESTASTHSKSKTEKYIDVVHCTADGGVIKKMISRGNGKKPEKLDEVVVHYIGYLEDGSVFDDSHSREDGFKFIIGADHVIKGWDIGILEMEIGEKAELIIAPEYAYGKIGNPPKIPGDATLTFVVEVLNTHERRPTKWMMSDEERIKVTLKLKEDGNFKFKNKEFKEAEGLYREALSHLNEVKIENKELRNLKKTVFLNIAVV